MFEVVFQIIKETSNIEGFEIFWRKFIYTAYAAQMILPFFLKILLETFQHFSPFSGLTPSKQKCEIAYRCFEGGKSDMRYVKLHENTIKILEIHYSYITQLEIDENFKKYIAKIENALKLWMSRKLSLIWLLQK